jgi:quinol monooxygenase YgiN
VRQGRYDVVAGAQQATSPCVETVDLEVGCKKYDPHTDTRVAGSYRLRRVFRAVPMVDSIETCAEKQNDA